MQTVILQSGLAAYGSICFVLVILFSAYLLYHFARPRTPPLALFLTWLSWLVAFSVCFLVPTDLISSTAKSLNTIWSVEFWFQFVLMWMILPFMSAYYANGEFTMKGKFKASLKMNGILIGVVGVLFGAGVLYLSIAKSFTSSDILSLVILMSNAWGLVMLVTSSGYGLVEVPRSLWRLSNLDRRLQWLRYLAPSISHEIDETRDELDTTIKCIRGAQSKLERQSNGDPDSQLMRWYHEIQNEYREREIELSASNRRTNPAEVPLVETVRNAEQISEKLLVVMNFQVKNVVRHLASVETQWRDLVDEVLELETVRESMQRDMLPPPTLNFYQRWIWWARVGNRTLVFKAIAVFFALCSIIVLWCEFAIVINQQQISLLGVLVSATEGSEFGSQLFTVIPLIYLSVCAFYPFYVMRLGKAYYIGKKFTDEGTLLFNATFVLRVATPLAYNFTMLVDIGASSLQDFIGSIDVIPFFGSDFYKVFPVFILVFAVLFLFNVFDYLFRCLGITRFQYVAAASAQGAGNRGEENESNDVVEEGTALINAERRRRELTGRIAERSQEVQQMRSTLAFANRSAASPPRSGGRMAEHSRNGMNEPLNGVNDHAINTHTVDDIQLESLNLDLEDV